MLGLVQLEGVPSSNGGAHNSLSWPQRPHPAAASSALPESTGVLPGAPTQGLAGDFNGRRGTCGFAFEPRVWPQASGKSRSFSVPWGAQGFSGLPPHSCSCLPEAQALRGGVPALRSSPNGQCGLRSLWRRRASDGCHWSLQRRALQTSRLTPVPTPTQRERPWAVMSPGSFTAESPLPQRCLAYRRRSVNIG